ncbi:hypothetical protein BJ741DRAFT_652714 [Chytriomyces cf. hyalinus JEL632]|nr:hypothetical protein BJ741DRAFT_652714 [Chytriomyces cf. hyalinus JEL632]
MHAQPRHETCTVCLNSLDPRGGSPLINPGCGHQLHLTCYSDILASPTANKLCPQCRLPLVNLPAQTPNAPPQQQQAPQFQQSVPQYPLPVPQYQPQQYQPQQYQQQQQGWNMAGLYGQMNNAYEFFIGSTDDALDEPTEDASVTVARPTLTWTPETDVFEPLSHSATSERLFTALLSIRAPEWPANAPEASLDLVMVIDVSGSMSGAKLDSVKSTLLYVIETLTSNDRLCIVEFDDRAHRLSPFLRCNERGAPRLREVAHRLRSKGGTNIRSGVEAALHAFTSRTEKNGSSAIMLLSDGQDSCRSNYSDLSARAKQAQIPIYTFGFGNSHDDAVLTRLAGTTGTFTFVSEPSIFQEAFSGCVGAVKSTLYRNLEIHIQAADLVPEGFIAGIDRVQTSYTATTDREGRFSLICFDDLYEEEQRDVIVTMRVSKVGMLVDGQASSVSEADNEHKLAWAACKYKSVLEKNKAVGYTDVDKVHLVVKTSATALQKKKANSSVTKQQLRLLALAAMNTSMELADAGNYAMAVARLKEAIEQVKETIANAHDVDKATVHSILEKHASGGSDLAGIFAPDDLNFYSSVVLDLEGSIKRSVSHTAQRSGGHANQNAVKMIYSHQRATWSTTNADMASNAFQQTSFLQQASAYQSHKSVTSQTRGYDIRSAQQASTQQQPAAGSSGASPQAATKTSSKRGSGKRGSGKRDSGWFFGGSNSGGN